MNSIPDDDSVKIKCGHFAQQGWQCPVCERVNAPWVSQCPCAPCGYPKYPTYPAYPPTQQPMAPQWPTITCCARSDNQFYQPERFTE